MQVEPSTRFANRALDSGERFLRRRSLYPAELRVHKPWSSIIQEDEEKVNSKEKEAGNFGLHP